MSRTALAVLLSLSMSPAAAAARGQTQQPASPPQATDVPARPIGAGELQKLFEAYTVLQAQDALQLSETQYGRFVTRLKALQDTRRGHTQTRNRILGDLRRLSGPQAGTVDDTLVTARLKALRDEEDQSTADVRKAYDAIDETLSPRQQARFRLFEDRMEQQKLELLMRARQNARAARGRGPDKQ